MNLKPVFAVTAAALALGLAAPASALTYTYAANLSGAAEGTASTAFGTAVVVFDDSALTVAVTELWAGLSGPVTGNHIHLSTTAGSGTGSVALGFTGVPAVATGFYSNTFTLPSGTGTGSFSALLAGVQAGFGYVNLHTAAYTGGEIRGFLTSTASAVPEAGTGAMLLAGLGAVGMVLRRRALR